MMKNKPKDNKNSSHNSSEEKKTNFEGYPIYPSTEDIYSHGHKEDNLDPEDTSKIKTPTEHFGGLNSKAEKAFENEMGEDLDVPGSELDDLQESIGSEDEENNYYSIGGDNHNDLEEDNT